MQLKAKNVPVVAKAGAEIDEDKLFIQYYGQCVNGLLAGNSYFSEDSLAWQERLETEDLVLKAEEVAQAMVEVVKERMEFERFERKLK